MICPVCGQPLAQREHTVTHYPHPEAGLGGVLRAGTGAQDDQAATGAGAHHKASWGP